MGSCWLESRQKAINTTAARGWCFPGREEETDAIAIVLRAKNIFLKYLKQALRKFSETAKGWYWNMGKLYKKYAVTLEIMLSELKMSGKWQTFWLLLIYLKQSTEQKGHFIKLWYLKWKGVDRDRTLHLLGLNWEADFSWYSWSNTVLWLVS